MVLFLAGVDNGGVTVFLCAKCGTELTPRLTALPAVPEMPEGRDEKTRRAPATVPRGHYAVEPEPWGAPYVAQEDQENPVPCQPRAFMKVGDGGFVISAGTRNTVVVHPDDAPGLQPLPDWANSNGCCGPTGTDGLNRACACGARVATLAADCFGPYELHLDPARVYPFDQ